MTFSGSFYMAYSNLIDNFCKISFSENKLRIFVNSFIFFLSSVSILFSKLLILSSKKLF